MRSNYSTKESNDVGVIYNRLLMLNQIHATAVGMTEVLKFELTPMFNVDGKPRIIKAKSDLKNGLQITIRS